MTEGFCAYAISTNISCTGPNVVNVRSYFVADLHFEIVRRNAPVEYLYESLQTWVLLIHSYGLCKRHILTCSAYKNKSLHKMPPTQLCFHRCGNT